MAGQPFTAIPLRFKNDPACIRQGSQAGVVKKGLTWMCINDAQTIGRIPRVLATE